MDSASPLPNPQPSDRPKEEEIPPTPELSAEELDAFLTKEDPEFVKKVEELEVDLAKSKIELADLKVEAEIDDKSDGKNQAENLAQKKWRWPGLRIFFRHCQNLPKRFYVWFVGGGYKTIVFAALNAGKAVIQGIQAGFKKFSTLGRRRQLALLFAILLSVLTIYVVQHLLQGDLIHLSFGPKFLTSFDSVADHVYEIPPDDTMDAFMSSIRHPDYYVLLEKVVVNLKREANSDANPMATTQLFLEAATREAAIEIKDRQNEILDLVQRTIEGMTYSELENVKGKNKLKIELRQQINGFLTRGRIRKVLFQTIVIKP